MIELSSRNSPLLVLGMHRSGTSAASGLIRSMGIPPARWCAESRANDVNPKGFFEPRPLVWENERLLAWLDSSWRHPPAQPSCIDWSGATQAHGRRSTRVFRRSARAVPWFWKDPRLCVLMPYWERLGITFRDVVLMTRNPADVSRSLERRNSMSEVESLDLWFLYMMAAVKHCEGREVFMLDYDDLVDHPVESGEELRAWMHFRGWDAGDSPTSDPIDPALRRSSSGFKTRKHPSEGLYEELRSHGRGGIALGPLSTLQDRSLTMRVHERRNDARAAWEAPLRFDRRVLRSVGRGLRIAPGAARELARR